MGSMGDCAVRQENPSLPGKCETFIVSLYNMELSTKRNLNLMIHTTDVWFFFFKT